MVQFRRSLVAALLVALSLASQAQTPAPSQFMRMQKPTATQEVLQTKARKYVPSKGDGPAIWLVGVAHIGQAGYYKNLQKLLDEQSCVLYEGVTRKGVDPAAKTTGKEDPRQKTTYQMLSDTLGLQFQLYGIDYSRPTFHNSDLSWEELTAIEAKHPGPKGGMGLAGIGGLLNADSDQGKQLASTLAMLKDDPGSMEGLRIGLMEILAEPGIVEKALSPSLGDLLIKTRNTKVLGDLKKELAKPNQKSIAVFFGGGHMPDMEKHLTADFGYVAGEERWFTTMQGDTAKVTGQGQMILSLMRAQLASMKKGR
ncbi:MAG: hypothetical protein ACHQ50_13910 [Fimbriimonadales bacterium]